MSLWGICHYVKVMLCCSASLIYKVPLVILYIQFSLILSQRGKNDGGSFEINFILLVSSKLQVFLAGFYSIVKM